MLELENSVIKMGFIQFGAMKSLCAILSSSTILEHLLVPKEGTKTNTAKDDYDKDLEKGENTDNVCPNCGKSHPPAYDYCTHCSSNASLESALADAFGILVKVRLYRATQK